MEIVTAKVCPCCGHEEPTTKLYTKTDYIGNGLAVDKHDRVIIICNDCKILYDWTWEAY